MTEPISRTELYERVDARFREVHPNAPARLDAHSEAQAQWRTDWIKIRDHMLNEEVDRVYWDRYPDAPLQIDDHNHDHQKYKRAWLEIRDEVMFNAPEPGDVTLGPVGAGSDEIDLSYVRSGVYESLVEELPTLKPELHDEIHSSLETAIAAVGKAAEGGLIGPNGWESPTYSVRDGMSEHGASFSVRAWYDNAILTGGLSMTIDYPLDR
jgi:hypothetical protein